MPTPAPADLFTTDQLTVYGSDWCGDCRRTKRFLDATNTPYTWVDRDADPVLKRRLADAGYLAIPVVVIPGGQILVEPSNAELAEALGVTV